MLTRIESHGGKHEYQSDKNQGLLKDGTHRKECVLISLDMHVFLHRAVNALRMKEHVEVILWSEP